MSGDLAKKEFFALSKEFDILLLVDEAHSSGILGKKLSGIFEYYQIKIEKNFVKMGTLGKAYGSYGAYILASKEIISFLENRAKSIIYATAPSLFDIALSYFNLKYMIKNSKKIAKKIAKMQKATKDILQIQTNSLIVPIKIKDNKRVLELQNELRQRGFDVGAIREPTVKEPILRVILRISEYKNIKKLLYNIKNLTTKRVE